MLAKNLKYILLVFGLIFSLAANAADKDVLDALFHNKSDPVAGNKNGKITIVEFFDYQCSHCMNMAPIIQSIIKNNPDVRIVFKEYPIFPSPVSDLAARAALAANLQGKYYRFHHALLVSDSPLNEESIFRIAKANGLDVNKLKKDMDSSSIKKIITTNKTLGNNLGVSGTPAFFIGKTNATDKKDVDSTLGELTEPKLQKEIQKLRS